MSESDLKYNMKVIKFQRFAQMSEITERRFMEKSKTKSVAHEPKPDNEPRIEVITITENNDSGLGGSETNITNVRLARKRRSNTNYHRWMGEAKTLVEQEDEKPSRKNRHKDKGGRKKSNYNNGGGGGGTTDNSETVKIFSGLKKRTPCPNVVAGKDGVIRSLDASTRRNQHSEKAGEGGGGKFYSKEETKEFLRKESTTESAATRATLRDNPRAVVSAEEKRESPPASTVRIAAAVEAAAAARPISSTLFFNNNREPVQRARQLLESSHSTRTDLTRLSSLQDDQTPIIIDLDPELQEVEGQPPEQKQLDHVDHGPQTILPSVVQTLEEEEEEESRTRVEEHLFDFEIIDVTDVVAMTRVLNSDNDSGVCLAGSGERGRIFDTDSIKSYITKDSFYKCNDVDMNNKGLTYQDIEEENRLRDERAMDVQHALIADQDGDRPLHIAVVHQDVILVRQLCGLVKSVGASVDMYNCLHQTPLHLSVILQDQHMCEALLEEGAKPYLRDRNGDTALHLAVKFKSVDCLNVILRSKLSRNILNERNYEGLSCLHLAVAQEEMVSAFYLVKAGCDINIQEGKSGRTPLINAVLCGKFDVVRILTKLGASILTTDYAGLNALQIANELDNRDISLYLETKMSSLKV